MARRWQRDRGKERFWRRMVGQWRRSGQSVRDFCAAHALSEPSFFAWRRTLADRDRQAAASAAANGRRHHARPPAPDDKRDRAAPAFVPVHVLPAATALEIVLGGGRVVRVPSGFDAATLRQLLAVLAEEPSC